MVNRITTGVAMHSESRGQSGLISAHQQLIQVWKASVNKGQLPERAAFDPGQLRMHLGFMSLAELDPDGEICYRFAGSRLRRLFGGDSRGRRLSSLRSDVSNLLGEGISEAIETQKPVSGLSERSVCHHAWLRLPLSGGAQNQMVLCHDQFFETSKVTHSRTESLFELSSKQAFMAA